MPIDPRFRATRPRASTRHQAEATAPAAPSASRRRGWALLWAALLLVGLFAGAVGLRAVFFPFVVAAIIAYVLEPLVGRVARRGLPRWVSVVVVYILFGFSVWGFGYSLIPKLALEGEKGVVKLQQLLRDAPSLYEDLRGRVGAWLNPAGGAQSDPHQFASTEQNDPISAQFGLGPNYGTLPPITPAPEVPALPEVKLSAGNEDAAAAEVLGGARGEFFPAESLSLQERIEAEQRANLIVEELGKGRYGVRLNESAFEVDERRGVVRLAPRDPGDQSSHLEGLQEQLTAAIVGGVERAGTRIFEAVLEVVQAVLQGLVGAMISFALVFMVAAFILIGAEPMRYWFRGLVPPRWQNDYTTLLQMLDRGLSGVVRGQLMICVVNGILSGIGFWIFIPEYAVVLAIFAGVMSLVPIFGTIISSAPAILVGLTIGPGTALAVLLWILGIHFIEANFLNPKIIGSAAHIHPVLVVFVLIAGEHLYGLPGVILSVPAVAIVQVFYTFIYHRIRPALWGESGSERGG